MLCLCLVLVLGGREGLAESDAPGLTLFAPAVPGYMGNPEPNPGMFVEMAQRAAQKFGYTVTQKIVPWARAMRTVRDRDDALIVAFSRIPHREKYYTWIAPQSETAYVFISLKSQVDTLAAARELASVGVFRATVHHAYLQDKGFKNIRHFDEFKRTIQMLEAGRLGAWFGSVAEFSQRWQRFATDPPERDIHRRGGIFRNAMARQRQEHGGGDCRRSGRRHAPYYRRGRARKTAREIFFRRVVPKTHRSPSAFACRARRIA